MSYIYFGWRALLQSTYCLSRPELPSTHLFAQTVYPRGFQLPETVDLIEEGEAEGLWPTL